MNIYVPPQASRMWSLAEVAGLEMLYNCFVGGDCKWRGDHSMMRGLAQERAAELDCCSANKRSYL